MQMGFPWGMGPERPTGTILVVTAALTIALALTAIAASPAITPVSAVTLDHQDDETGEPPLAEAGLDQEANVYAPVYLDAGGSYAPEGEIESYEWAIERPDGGLTTPECGDCVRTHFVPEMDGTYEVTVRVTASNGLSSEDTMYVEVHDRDPPEVELDGPSTGSIGQEIPLSLNGEPGTHPLMAVTWYVNGEVSHSDFLDENGPWEEPFTFPEPGIYDVMAEIVDESGFSGVDTHQIVVDADGAFFDVTITGTNSPVGDDEDLRVTARVENVGDRGDTQPITLQTGAGDMVAVHPALTLEAGDSRELTLEWPACLDADTSTMAVSSEDASDEVSVDISEAGCVPGFFAIDDVSAPSTAEGGDLVPIEATVTNTGNGMDTQFLTLENLHGDIVPPAGEQLTLSPGETETVTLEWETEPLDAGEGTVTVHSFDDHGTAPMAIVMPPYYAVSIEEITPPTLDDDAYVVDDEHMTVVAVIENIGTRVDEQDIELRDGEGGPLRGTVPDLRLEPGENTTIEADWEVDGAFELGETYPIYVGSEHDNATDWFRIGYHYYRSIWVSALSEYVFPGQTLALETEVHTYEGYDVYSYSGGREAMDDIVYKLKNSYTNSRGSFITRGSGDNIWSGLTPPCGPGDCSGYYEQAALQARFNAVPGQQREQCFYPWPYNPETDFKPNPSWDPEHEEVDPAGYRPYCQTVEIVDEDDDRVEFAGGIEVQMFDRYGNTLGRSDGEATHDNTDEWQSTDLDGIVQWDELEDGLYDITARADGHEKTGSVRVESPHRENISFQFDNVYPTGDVEINVEREQTGEPLEEAYINFLNYNADGYTDSSGKWTGEVKATAGNPIPSHSVYVEYEGHETIIEINVRDSWTDEETVTFDVDEPGQGDLQVTVADEMGNLLANADVYEVSETPTFSGQTDSHGVVDFSDLETGTYEIEAEHDDSTTSRIADIEDGETTEITIVIITGLHPFP